MEKRNLLIAGRLGAAVIALASRRQARLAAWALHDFLWLYPTLRRNCGWHGRVVTQFVPEGRQVWLTIDDGPDRRDTPEILDLLERHGARATFFVIGKKAEAHPGLCRQIVDAGHALGNHTWSHPAGAWWILPRPMVRREIELGNRAIFNASGHRPSLFRSPVGMNGLAIHPVAESLGLQVIGWSSAGGDGCPHPPSTVADRIMRSVRPGAIILLHEAGGGRRRPATLARLLERLGETGYRCLLPRNESLC